MTFGKQCPICGNIIKKKIGNIGVKILYCKECDLEYIENTSKLFRICSYFNKDNEKQYVNVLKSIETVRKNNNKKILDILSEILPPDIEQNKRKKGLEVGCATGLFMEEACRKGYEMFGIEPMETSYNIAKEKGLNVSLGFFPNDIDMTQKYDFIIFNDVFEHIPNISDVMKACYQLLSDKGILIINLPDKNGSLYKISKILYKLGDHSSFERLWQLGTSSPHLYYFSQRSLDKLNAKYNFQKIKYVKMQSFSRDGLQDRINAIPISKVKSKVYNLALNALYPILCKMHSDTGCHIYIRNQNQTHADR